MKRILILGLMGFAAALSTTSLAFAQSADAEPEDKSGTNPAKLSRSFTITNDFRWLDKGRWYNQPQLRFSQPFNDSTMNLQVKVPLPSTNLAGGKHITGVGDIGLKWSWIAHIDRRQGVIVSAEVTAPTASEKVLGGGKWLFSPGVTYAVFLSPELILAPALVYTTSFAGDDKRSSVSRVDLDIYTVYKPKGQNWWLTSDLTVGYDFMTKKIPATYKLALGTNIGRIGDAAVNLSIQPGIGIGVDKPLKYSIQASISVVGF
jgi:hypothetical protein